MNPTNTNPELPALLIIDMVKDNFKDDRQLPITKLARGIIKPINQLIHQFRSNNWPVIFSTDSFHPEDFIFTGRMQPHSLAGTEGAEVVGDLDMQEQDVWLPKPRFSAFFKTGLEKELHELGITLCALAGIATHFCVLTSAMDAVCHDFKAVILEDCSTSFDLDTHQQTLDLYRRNPLYPLFRVMTANALLKDLKSKSAERT